MEVCASERHVKHRGVGTHDAWYFAIMEDWLERNIFFIYPMLFLPTIVFLVCEQGFNEKPKITIIIITIWLSSQSILSHRSVHKTRLKVCEIESWSALKMSAAGNGNLPTGIQKQDNVYVSLSLTAMTQHLRQRATMFVFASRWDIPLGGEMSSTWTCPLHKSSFLWDALFNAVWLHSPEFRLVHMKEEGEKNRSEGLPAISPFS